MLILGLKGLTTPIGSLAGTQFVTSPSRLVPNSRQPAAGRINWLLGTFVPATFVIHVYRYIYIYFFFQDKLFVPLLAQIYENETCFSL